MGRTRRCTVWRNDTRYVCTFQFLPDDLEYNMKLQSRTVLGSPTVMGMTWKMGVRMAMRSIRGML